MVEVATGGDSTSGEQVNIYFRLQIFTDWVRVGKGFTCVYVFPNDNF